MKRCANPKCRKLFVPDWRENRAKYCQNCRQRYRNPHKQDTYRMKHEKARVGNSKQDKEVLKFLKEKRKKEDSKYSMLYNGLYFVK